MLSTSLQQNPLPATQHPLPATQLLPSPHPSPPMPRPTLARTRRSHNPQEPSLRLITFQVRNQWFCLPLVLARRVIAAPMGDQPPVPGLAQLHQENVPLVDIAPLIFQAAPAIPGTTEDPPLQMPANPQSTILVIDPPQVGAIGLLVAGTPAIKRAKKSDFSPVPSMYLIMNRLQGIHTLVTLSDNHPPVFLLDVDALLARLMQP